MSLRFTIGLSDVILLVELLKFAIVCGSILGSLSVVSQLVIADGADVLFCITDKAVKGILIADSNDLEVVFTRRLNDCRGVVAIGVLRGHFRPAFEVRTFFVPFEQAGDADGDRPVFSSILAGSILSVLTDPRIFPQVQLRQPRRALWQPQRIRVMSETAISSRSCRLCSSESASHLGAPDADVAVHAVVILVVVYRKSGRYAEPCDPCRYRSRSRRSLRSSSSPNRWGGVLHTNDFFIRKHDLRPSAFACVDLGLSLVSGVAVRILDKGRYRCGHKRCQHRSTRCNRKPRRSRRS